MKMINKEDLKKYNIICTDRKEAYECIDMLKKLGFNIDSYNNFTDFNCIVHYSEFFNEFYCKDTVYRSRKNINFYQFKKLFKKLTKQETKDFEVNNKGQITKINNYDSKKTVYFFNIFFENATYDCYDSCVDICSIKDCKKNFWDKCIQYGVLFNTEENAEKFIEYIKDYNKE